MLLGGTKQPQQTKISKNLECYATNGNGTRSKKQTLGQRTRDACNAIFNNVKNKKENQNIIDLCVSQRSTWASIYFKWGDDVDLGNLTCSVIYGVNAAMKVVADADAAAAEANATKEAEAKASLVATYKNNCMNYWLTTKGEYPRFSDQRISVAGLSQEEQQKAFDDWNTLDDASSDKRKNYSFAVSSTAAAQSTQALEAQIKTNNENQQQPAAVLSTLASGSCHTSVSLVRNIMENCIWAENNRPKRSDEKYSETKVNKCACDAISRNENKVCFTVGTVCGSDKLNNGQCASNGPPPANYCSPQYQ